MQELQNGLFLRCKAQLGLNLAWISLDFIESKSRNEESKTFLSPYPGAFEQLFCPGGGAFASLLSKNPNSRGSARGGWALLKLTDA